jgi:hypothetical protein
MRVPREEKNSLVVTDGHPPNIINITACRRVTYEIYLNDFKIQIGKLI